MQKDSYESSPIYKTEMKDLFYNDFKIALDRLGVQKGDTLFVHSDISKFGKIASKDRKFVLDTLVAVLRDSVGESGNIIMPTFSYSYCNNEIFDVENTKSTVGVLTEHFRVMDGVERTRHPIFSASVIGADKEYFLDIDKNLDSFGEDSIFSKVHKKGGKFLYMGVALEAATYLHYVEQSKGVDYRYIKEFSGITQTSLSKVENSSTFYVRDLDRNVILDTTNLQNYLLEKEFAKKTSVGYGSMMIVTAEDLFDQTTKLLDENKYYLLDEEVLKIKCPYCSSLDTRRYFHAKMPNVLSVFPKSMQEFVKSYQLNAYLCQNCMLGFNINKLSDEQLKIIYDNYFYISPLNGIGVTKYVGMIEDLINYFDKDDKIAEIGCSEGYLINELEKRGFRDVVGFEPGPQADEAISMGLNVKKTYFNEDSISEEKYDGFYLMHVFEHFDDPFSIMNSMKKCLTKSGKIVIEVPYFSDYHHQHLYYYNYNFLKRLCSDLDLKIIDVVIEKGAIRIVIVNEENMSYKAINFDETLDDIDKMAIESNSEMLNNVDKITEILERFSSEKVFWWGAGSTSVIYLNQINEQLLSKLDIEIVDGDSNKYGKIVPHLNYEVKPYSEMQNKENECLIIASSFSEEIKETMKENHIVVKNVFVVR